MSGLQLLSAPVVFAMISAICTNLNSVDSDHICATGRPPVMNSSDHRLYLIWWIAVLAANINKLYSRKIFYSKIVLSELKLSDILHQSPVI